MAIIAGDPEFRESATSTVADEARTVLSVALRREPSVATSPVVSEASEEALSDVNLAQETNATVALINNPTELERTAADILSSDSPRFLRARLILRRYNRLTDRAKDEWKRIVAQLRDPQATALPSDVTFEIAALGGNRFIISALSTTRGGINSAELTGAEATTLELALATAFGLPGAVAAPSSTTVRGYYDELRNSSALAFEAGRIVYRGRELTDASAAEFETPSNRRVSPDEYRQILRLLRVSQGIDTDEAREGGRRDFVGEQEVIDRYVWVPRVVDPAARRIVVRSILRDQRRQSQSFLRRLAESPNDPELAVYDAVTIGPVRTPFPSRLPARA